MSSLVLPGDAQLAAMTPAEREALWRQFDRERTAMEVQLARLTHQLGDGGYHLVDGHRSLRNFGRAACNWSTSEAARMERLGRLLARYPTVSSAADAGRLGLPQLHVLAQLLKNPRVIDQLDEAIDLLVEQACSLDFDDLVTAVVRWESLADEDGAGDRHERAHRNRNARLHLDEHGFTLEANGGNAVGVQVKEILDAYVHSEFLHDWEAGKAEHGDAMCPALMARTDAQRRADALHAIFLAATGAGSGSGSATGANVTVNLMIGYDRFQQELARMLTDNPHAKNPADPDPVDPNDPAWLWQPSETMDGYQLDPRDVVAAAVGGRVRRIVVDSAGVMIDVGRKQRLFTGALRDAVLLAHARCTHGGCPIHASKCQADHTVPHADDGPTSLDNGGPQCGHHNRFKTRGYTTKRDERGHWHTYRPDGTEIGWRADPMYTNTGTVVDAAQPVDQPIAGT